MTDVVSLAAELLAIQSTTGSEASAVDFVSRWLVARGWNVALQEVTRGRANIWGSRSGGGGGVTFSTHLDTVPPYVPPRLEGTRLFGRGSSDAKGIAAAMMVAADRLVANGEKRIDVLFVVGEEKGSDGARAANNLSTKSRFLINGEPTESKLATGAKGSLRATIRTRGREAHSAYPHLGQSAIEPMLDLLPTLRKLPLPKDPMLGETTVNIGTIKGGTEANVIPAHAESEIMFRLVGDVEPIRKLVLDWAKGHADVEFGSHIPAQRFATVPGFQTGPVAYTSDIPLLSNWGEPFLFGPGSIHVAHTPDEYIEVDELRKSVDTYERLANTLLAR
jgi:acetylornithine deacetylase/succinyl-diaminopimelate desuccinylase-like protein